MIKNINGYKNKSLRQTILELPKINQSMVDYYNRVQSRLGTFEKSVKLFQKINLRPGFTISCMCAIVQEAESGVGNHWNIERVKFYSAFNNLVRL